MSNNEKKKIKYFLYARKSSESEERQVQSIDDQVNRLKKLAGEIKIPIKSILTEAKSAKKPNNRPLFEEMVDRIKNGEAEGILCWQMNRLSRNPVDSGTISWLLQQGVIKSIRTIDREYLPDDNVLLMSVESGMANQFLLELSKNVKRGLQGKLEQGWRPGPAPMGYLNDTREHILLKDEERFPLIRKAWDLMLTGNYTVPKILKILNDDWGFRSPKSRHSGNKPLAMSGLYKIFTNIFYTGIIDHKGQHYPGKHPAMVTAEEYDQAQIILGRKGKPRPKSHEFAFTGMIRCAECGCMITAETKTKIRKSDNSIKKYTYYHCTKRKTNIPCSQKECIREEKLEAQIEAELKKYTILPEFREFALEVLNSANDKEIESRKKIHENQSRTLLETQNQLDNLTRMRYRDLIEDDEFIKEKNLLTEQITKLKQNLRNIEDRAENWLKLTEKAFDFATYAKKAFAVGNLQTKKEILAALGSNFSLKDGKLSINANDWLQPIANSYPALEKQYLRLEPAKKPMNKTKTEALTSVIAQWHGLRESNPR